MSPEKIVQSLIDQVEQLCRERKYARGSFARKSVANGLWSVARDMHPEIAAMKDAFWREAVGS